MEKYDLIVLGSGPAGYSAAMRAVDFGKNVCIVEANHLGGAGIMNGALTSKTMWELSRDFDIASSTDRGFRASGLIVDYEKVRKTVIQAAKYKQYQLLSQIETFSKGKSGLGSVTLKTGFGKFINRKELEVSTSHGREVIGSENFIIATGSRPRNYDGLDVDGLRIINSDSVLNLMKFPERIVIIGSGIIGCEFATIFSNFKQTQVHLLDRTNRVLPFEDDDVSNFVSKNLESNGVQIHYTATLRAIRKHADFLEVVLDYADGHSKVIEVDVALIAIGRVPNTEHIGLENVGIETSEKGFININEECSINWNNQQCNIFAAGDVTGYAQLYSVAELQGRYAAKGIFQKTIYPLSYSNMSTLMFFKPEVAAVGMNERMLQKNNIPYRMVWYSNELVNRAIAMQNTNGFIKIMISADGSDKIYGMRAAGPQASAFIVSVAHLINEGNSLQDVMKTTHPHPSITEGIQECLRVFSSKSIFKPQAFPEFIKIKDWKP